MGRSYQLARIFGIRIGVSASWFFVLFFLLYVLAGYFRDVLPGSDTRAYGVAVAATALFFSSLIFHELGHALVARRKGIHVQGIDLWFFGGMARLSREPRTPGEEFQIAVAGPAVNFVLAAVSIGLGLIAQHASGTITSARFGANQTTPAVALLGWTGFINVALLLLNIVPAFPLDGGRIARAIAWWRTGDRNRATRVTARIGEWFGYLVIAVGIVFVIDLHDPTDGIYFAVLGWFLASAAKSARMGSEVAERLEGVTVADLMDTEPVVIPGELTALRAQDEFFLRYRWPWFCVVDSDQHFLGVLRAERVDGAVTAGQPVLPARELLDDDAEQLSIDPATPLPALLNTPALRMLGALAVVDGDGRLAGVVTLERVRRALIAGAGA